MNLCNLRSLYLFFLVLSGSFCVTMRAAELKAPASCCVMSSDGKVFFVGTAQDNAGKFTLAGGNRDDNNCLPIMTDMATINGEADKKNPLYNSAITHLSLIEERDLLMRISRYKPIVVCAQEPATIYSVEQYEVIKEKDTQEKKDTASKAASKDAPNASKDDAKKEEKKENQTQLTVVHAIKDSANEVTGGIIAVYTVSSNPATIAAAVKSHTGVWGEPGSGIALVEAVHEERELTAEEKKAIAEAKKKDGTQSTDEANEPHTKKVLVLKQLDVWEEKPAADTIVRALPLDVSCDAVKIGGNLASLGTAIDMHWNDFLKRLYIALQPTAGAGTNDGARSIVVGYLESIYEVDQVAAKKKADKKKAQQKQNDKADDKDDQIPYKRRVVLHLQPLLPDAACADAQDGIVGARGASVQLHAYSVRTLSTSTYLHYLIVQGGVGDAQETKRMVYALPLVSKTAEFDRIKAEIQKKQTELSEKKKAGEKAACAQLQATIDALNKTHRSAEYGHGVLANKNEVPCATDLFSAAAPYRLIDRSFRSPATTASEATAAHDQAALVGGGRLAAGDITSLVVRGDAIFVTVGAADSGQQPGIFYSRALFDQTGAIKSWTRWQRAGTFVSASGQDEPIVKMELDGASQMLCAIGAPNAIVALKRSVWSKGAEKENKLVNVLNAALEKEPAGALALVDFPAGSPGLSDISLLALLSSRSVTLAHTGSLVNGNVVPEMGNGAEHVVTLRDGELAHVGPLTCAEIMPYKNGGVLCVGGVHGIAVLVDVAGNGFPALQHLAQLTDLQWKKIADWPFISKLIYDDGFLYALSDTKLVRIDLAQLDLSGKTVFYENTRNLSGKSLSHENTRAGTVAGSGDSRSALGVNMNRVLPEACIPELATCITELASIESIPALGAHGIFTDCVISGKLALLGTNKGLLRIGDDRDIRTTCSSISAHWVPIAVPEPIETVTRLIPLSVTGRAQDVASCGGGMLYLLDVSLGSNKGHLVRLSVRDTQQASIDAASVQLLSDCFCKGGCSPFVDFESYKDQFVTDGALHMVIRNRDGQQAPSIQALMPGVRTGHRGIGKAAVMLPIDMSKAHDIAGAVRCSATGAWFVGGDMGVYSNE